MSASPETDFDLELHFLPAWAKEAPDEKRYQHFAGEAPREERPRGPRRDRGPRREYRSGGPRPDRDRIRGGPPRGGGSGPRPHDQRERFDKPKQPPAPLLEITVAFIPDDKGVESLARQIKMTGRAYPLFDIAQMILQKPERHNLTLSSKKDAEGKPLQALYVCALDETIWISEDEAIRYVLDKHFTTFYQPERTRIDGPKGTYTFVAQCGMSGAILGPPNYHDYQNQLRKLHAERFSRMPFDAFKARVKIVKDDEVVKKWIEEQSWKTEYVCLNMPEPLKLASREEVEKHFREVHLLNIIKQVETAKLTGTASRQLRSQPLARAVRVAWEEQRRFPLQIATVLSQQFAAHGLQFFKVNKTITHVSVARPHYLDLETVPVSDGIRKIVHYVNEHPRRTRRNLVEALVPSERRRPEGRPSAVAVVRKEEAPSGPSEKTPPEGQAPSQPTGGANSVEPSSASPELSPEVTTIVSDLHWLIHQGHVIEFANGALETAKKPLPRPPKPASTPPAEQPAEAADTTSPAEIKEGDNQPQAAEVSAATEAVTEPVTTPEPEPAPEVPAETAAEKT